MSRIIFIFLAFILSACQNVSEKQQACPRLDTAQIKSIVQTDPKWPIPIRAPGPIQSFSDMRGVVLHFPLKVSAGGEARIRKMIIEEIKYVEKANGELAVAEIRAHRDDGEVIHAVNLAQGRAIVSVADLTGAKIVDRSKSETGVLVVQQMALASRADGLLVIADYVLKDEAGNIYTMNAELEDFFSCQKTLVNVCACPNFFGYCDDSNYPDCATESCNFGNAQCEARVEISCPGFCVRDGLPGVCFYVPLVESCGCFVIKTPDEM